MDNQIINEGTVVKETIMKINSQKNTLEKIEKNTFH